MTSSYLRAVNVLASSSSRSKKRQSPAASLPIVDKLIDCAAAYAEAQAMRFERSSVSIASEDSRKIPTAQGNYVGKFLLAPTVGKSDKSAMTTLAQIRATIRDALAARGKGAIATVNAMKAEGLTTVNRTYLSDFLDGSKDSLSFDFTQELADFLQMDVQLLRIKKHQPADIRKGAKPHLYIAEHMKQRGWDDTALASRIDGIAGPDTMESWRTHPEKLVDWQIRALLHAFSMDAIEQITRPPAPKPRAQTPQQRKTRKRA